jgi:hypothetical protein
MANNFYARDWMRNSFEPPPQGLPRMSRQCLARVVFLGPTSGIPTADEFHFRHSCYPKVKNVGCIAGF